MTESKVLSPELTWANINTKSKIKEVLAYFADVLAGKENNIANVKEDYLSLDDQYELEKTLIKVQRVKPDKIKPEFEFEANPVWKEANKKLVSLKYGDVLRDYERKLAKADEAIADMDFECSELRKKIKFGKNKLKNFDKKQTPTQEE